MSKRDDRPVPLAAALDEFLRRKGLRERLARAAVVPDWADRVGDRIAAVTVPLRVSGEVLVVAVRSSAWLMELKLMEREILDRLNAGRETVLIRGIRFLMAEDVDAAPEAGRKRRFRSGPDRR